MHRDLPALPPHPAPPAVFRQAVYADGSTDYATTGAPVGEPDEDGQELAETA